MEMVEALRSTGAVRDFVPELVSDDVVFRLLDTARFAPNGGNRQAWRAVLLKDPAVKRELRDLYLAHWYEYLAMSAAGLAPYAPIHDDAAEAEALLHVPEVEAAARARPGFAERLDEAPVLLVLLADLRALAAIDRGFDRYTLVGGASIYPFAWSILLAAHAEGLGGVLTTMAVREEPSVKALLGVPDEFCVAGVLALGRPVKRATKLRRNPVESFTTVDRYDGPAFAG